MHVVDAESRLVHPIEIENTDSIFLAPYHNINPRLCAKKKSNLLCASNKFFYFIFEVAGWQLKRLKIEKCLLDQLTRKQGGIVVHF